MSDVTDTNTTPTTPPQGSDPIRPAHYRDPNTGRDRIAVWREVLDTYHFQAAIAATVDRYLSRAGRKPGVPAEVDHAKAAEVVRRYYEEWGEGAQEELFGMLADLGHDREAINALLRAAEQPRTPTPPATQDDHAAALQRERERADRAERALRLERGAPQPGDLPEGWRREPCTPRSYVNGTAKAVCLETGEWRWWCREGWGRSTTAAEAIDAANAAITAQRSDDTARDDSGSAAGEGEVTP